MARLLGLPLAVALVLASAAFARAQFEESPFDKPEKPTVKKATDKDATSQSPTRKKRADKQRGDAEGKLAPEFPESREQWLHGLPLTLEALKGKAAFLWFFEESCPRCRESWPKLVALSKQYEGQPVIFIGVSSGTSPAEIDAYLRDTRVPWPIILDPERTYEKDCGVQPVSLQNIYVVRLITADGRMIEGSWSDIEGSVKKALEGAAWKVDPADIPSSLRVAWQAVELNNFAMAGPTIKRNLTSTKPDVKQAAVKLRDAVQVHIDKDLAEAKAAEEQGRLWDAYQIYADVSEQYKGFDAAVQALVTSKKLLENPDVKANQAAQRELNLALKALDADNASSRTRAQTILQKIVTTMPSTAAAKEAESLLKQLRSGEL